MLAEPAGWGYEYDEEEFCSEEEVPIPKSVVDFAKTEQNLKYPLGLLSPTYCSTACYPTGISN